MRREFLVILIPLILMVFWLNVVRIIITKKGMVGKTILDTKPSLAKPKGPEMMGPGRYHIAHEIPEEGYVILNGVKRSIYECKDL